MKNRKKLSVVLVSDFEPNELKSWRDELRILEQLAGQDIEIPFEVILIESECHENQGVPPDFYEFFPDLGVYYCDSTKSAELKDYGVSRATGQFAAVLESDCLPSRNWLRLLLHAVESTGLPIASGRTYYGDETSYLRIMSLLHRSWYDHRESCETNYISNNGAIYDRNLLMKFPYPDAVTPFISATLRNKEINKAGYRCYYERTVTMRHAIGGWSFIWDLQRNKGHQHMTIENKPSLWKLPIVLAKKLIGDMRNTVRMGTLYLRWQDWPMLPLYSFAQFIPFTVGAVDALKKVRSIPGSAYR